MDGDCFLVERMPADHSRLLNKGFTMSAGGCGFHGIGVDRETAAALLLQNLDDAEVEAFIAFHCFSMLLSLHCRTFWPETSWRLCRLVGTV